MAKAWGIETNGIAAYRAALKRKGSAVNLATRRATTKSAHVVERAVKRALRTYPHAPGTPTPAPVGGPPGLITGNLARSQRVSPVRRVGTGTWSAMTGPTAAYGRAQELGRPEVRLPARPFQKPTTRRQLATIRRIYRNTWAEALKA